MVKIMIEDKKKVILVFLLQQGNKGFSQGQIAGRLMEDLGYKNVQTARVSVGNIMQGLSDDGKVYFRVKASRSIPSKNWFVRKKWMNL